MATAEIDNTLKEIYELVSHFIKLAEVEGGAVDGAFFPHPLAIAIVGE